MIVIGPARSETANARCVMEREKIRCSESMRLHMNAKHVMVQEPVLLVTEKEGLRSNYEVCGNNMVR